MKKKTTDDYPLLFDITLYTKLQHPDDDDVAAIEFPSRRNKITPEPQAEIMPTSAVSGDLDADTESASFWDREPQFPNGSKFIQRSCWVDRCDWPPDIGEVIEAKPLHAGGVRYKVHWVAGNLTRLNGVSGHNVHFRFLEEMIPLPDGYEIRYPDDSVSDINKGGDTESSQTDAPPGDSVSPLINREAIAPVPTPVPHDSVSGIEEGADTESFQTEAPPDDSVSPPINREAIANLKYRPRGSARTINNYFRYSYRGTDGKMRHKHIPGGSTSSPLAQQRWEEVQEMKRLNTPSWEIVRAIESWT